jgi:hypothetical protein
VWKAVNQNTATWKIKQEVLGRLKTPRPLGYLSAFLPESKKYSKKNYQ